MFLAIDESFGGNYCTIGALCVPLEKLPIYEREFVDLRIQEKVWGELKWTKIKASYLKKYKTFIEMYLSKPDVTVHTWTYENFRQVILDRHYGGIASEAIYHHIYDLIRTIIWKCQNADITTPCYILGDENGEIGQKEYNKIGDYLLRDRKINPSPDLKFCSPGNSVSCGAIQMADICAGAVNYSYREQQSDVKDEVIQKLRKLNKGISITNAPKNLPDLEDRTLYHFLFDENKVNN